MLHLTGDNMNDWRDIAAAAVIGLALAALALHYFDVLFF
jgi:hypothetical protein